MNCKTSDGLSIYYELKGTPSGPPLVFLNGLTQSTAAWAFFLPYFEKRYRIVLMDFVFQGQSDKDGEWRDFDTHARDVAAVLDACRIDAATVCGISYGSLVAQHFALLFPARAVKLVLISTFAHKTPYYEAIELSWRRALESGGYNLLLDIMLPSVLGEEYFSHPIIPLEVLKNARRDANQDAGAILKLMRATRERRDYRADLRRIAAPTLIIHGARDLLLPLSLAEEVHRSIARSKLVVIPHAGHTLNLEHVPEVCSHIVGFLENV